MKRSVRFNKYARQHVLTGTSSLAVSVAAMTWVPTAFLSGHIVSGGALTTAAVGTLIIGILFLLEAFRLRNMARTESRWEWERKVRPRL